MRHYLRAEPAEDLDGLIEQYVEALWIEERQIEVMKAGTIKAFAGR